jgi:hypothetical protein
MSSYRSVINTPEYPAQLFISGTRLSSLVRLFQVIEPDDTPGNQEIRQQPLRVLLPRRPRVLAPDDYHPNPLVALTLPVAYTATGVAVDTHRMNLLAQRAPLLLKSEMTSCYKIEYVICGGGTSPLFQALLLFPQGGAPYFRSRGRKTSCQATEIPIGKFAL